MKHKLTVLFPMYNEEHNIKECIESVGDLADELLFVDSFSTDGTLDIVREFDGRIIQREYENSASQKNWALPQCTHPWVLIVDADERLTNELREEIRAILDMDEPPHTGYRITRQNYFFGHPIYHCGWETDDVLRLFRVDSGRYLEREVHADIDLKGSCGECVGKLKHFTYTQMSQYLEKFGRYTTWSANDLKKNGRRANVSTIFFRPIARFFKMFFIRRGFLDGFPGLVLCLLATMSVFMKYAKLWRLCEDEKRDSANT